MITGPVSRSHRDSSEPAAAAHGSRLSILHVDMDAFYVEVERRRDPSLVGRAVIVGGSGRRGVVASASYEARASGVRSAMPTARARRLCPDAVVVTSDFSSYIEASEAIAGVFESVTPHVEPIALDEAFLDVSGAHRLFGTSAEIAWHIRGEVSAATGLDCSVGVASTKTLAKLASVAAKPVVAPSGPQPGLGVRVVEVADQMAFLWGHRVEALWGVGPVTLERLNAIGVASVGDLARVPVDILASAVGSAHGTHLAALARGLDDRPVRPGGTPKSIGHEETFETDVFDTARIHSEIVRLADAVSARLRAAGLAGRTVTLKIRYPDFSLRTRAHTLAEPIRTARVLATVAQRLTGRIDLAQGVRLLGVSVSNLAETPSARETVTHSANETHRTESLHGAESMSSTSVGTAGTPPTQLALDLQSAPGAVAHAQSHPGLDLAIGPTGDSSVDQQLAEALDAIRARFGRASIAHGAAAMHPSAPGERRWGR